MNVGVTNENYSHTLNQSGIENKEKKNLWNIADNDFSNLDISKLMLETNLIGC